MPEIILADENVNFKIIRTLRTKGFTVLSVLEEHQGLDDKSILLKIKKEKLILLTEDSDFGRLVFAYNEKDISVIFLRYEVLQLDRIIDSLIKVLNKYGEKLKNKFIVVTTKKIRIREI